LNPINFSEITRNLPHRLPWDAIELVEGIQDPGKEIVLCEGGCFQFAFCEYFDKIYPDLIIRLLDYHLIQQATFKEIDNETTINNPCRRSGGGFSCRRE